MPRTSDNTYVEFFTEAVRDAVASAEAKREVFKEVEFAKIGIIGDRDNNVVMRADEQFMADKANGGFLSAADRYPDIYKAFKAGLDEAVSGTPLNHLPFLGKAQIAELKHANIKTAEMLASLGEGAVDKGMGWRNLRDQTRLWLDDADKNAVAMRAKEDADQARAERDEMAARMAEMEAKLAALAEPKRKA